MKLKRISNEIVRIIPEDKLDKEFIHYFLNNKDTWYFPKKLEGKYEQCSCYIKWSSDKEIDDYTKKMKQLEIKKNM